MTLLLRKIERYCIDNKIAPTRFGRIAVNDPRLVGDLKLGRELGPRVRAKVEAVLRGNEA